MTGDVTMLVNVSMEGKLATRADASKHQGDYRKIVQGVNETLDAVIGPFTLPPSMWTGSARAIFRPRLPTPTTATSTKSRTT